MSDDYFEPAYAEPNTEAIDEDKGFEKLYLDGNQQDTEDMLSTFEQLINDSLSLRAKDWIEFSMKVLAHIESYTIPQYGDKGADQITNWTAEECLKAVKKRLDRFGRNSRDNQQELDFMKMAHEVQLAYDKYLESPEETDVCEWELVEPNGLDFISSCKTLISIDVDPKYFQFCVSCGKKIKVKS
jgi:hypothetical protein